jgi:hypothetical protein
MALTRNLAGALRRRLRRRVDLHLLVREWAPLEEVLDFAARLTRRQRSQ